jgi:hypothetical protein
MANSVLSRIMSGWQFGANAAAVGDRMVSAAEGFGATLGERFVDGP